MRFVVMRVLVNPVIRNLVCCTLRLQHLSRPLYQNPSGSLYRQQSLLFQAVNHLHILTDTSFFSLSDNRPPRQRPTKGVRKKRKALRPKGPYAWVKYTPGEPILPKNPNEGSVKFRKERKRYKKRIEYKLANVRKAIFQSKMARRKRRVKETERKIAAVAREKAWAEKLEGLLKLEEESKKRNKSVN